MDPAAGPAIFVHCIFVIVPSSSVPEPARFTDDCGKVMVRSLPALATGGMLAGVPLPTTTVTVLEWLAPKLFTTVKRNT